MAFIERRDKIGRGDTIDRATGRAQRGARADLLGHFLLGPAVNAIDLVGQTEVEHHLGVQVGSGQIAAHKDGFAFIASTLAIEGKTDGIEHGALAGAGWAVNQKQRIDTECLEVDPLGPGKGTKGLDRQLNRFHDGSPGLALAPPGSTGALVRDSL